VRVIAAGRASEIVDLGDGRVLRRYKGGGRPDREARIMAHARAHGFPVPHVHEVRDDGLVLERIDGPTMLADVWARPWRAPGAARTLAALHARLHAILFEDGRLLHLDLHPENVLLAPRGPVVIDWANARGGDPAIDDALTWVICATSAGLRGRAFGSLFLRHRDREAVRRALPDAAALRLADRGLSPSERRRVAAVSRRARPRA
jgi:hypothetical protein